MLYYIVFLYITCQESLIIMNVTGNILYSLIRNHIICILHVICKFVIQKIFRILILLFMHVSLTMLDFFTKASGLINEFAKVIEQGVSIYYLLIL